MQLQHICPSESNVGENGSQTTDYPVEPVSYKGSDLPPLRGGQSVHVNARCTYVHVRKTEWRRGHFLPNRPYVVDMDFKATHCIKQTLPSKVLSGETEWEIPKVPPTIPSPIRMATAIEAIRSCHSRG